MAKQALLQGAYPARSYIAEAQRCLNLYLEKNPEDAPYPTTHYPTPGLTVFSSAPRSGRARALYQTTGGAVFAVVGRTVYMVASNGTWTTVGTIDNRTNPVSMSDNGATVLLVDGSDKGYLFSVGGTGWTQITDEAFLGGTRVDILDQYFVINQPNSRNFYISDFNDTTFDSLNIAAKITYPDELTASVVMKREIWQIGQFTTEVWFNSGASDFTFEKMPGVLIEYGCNAAFSIADADEKLFWLAQDRTGRAIVVAGSNYKAERISNYAIENEIKDYEDLELTEGFCYQQDGHLFYVLNFPTEDRTWVYDATASASMGYPIWHERGWSDVDGVLHRARPAWSCSAFGLNLVLDHSSGQIYYYDLDSYTDNGDPVQRLRSFPHIKNENKRIEYQWLMAEFEVGKMPETLTSDPEMVWLRYSDDGGNTWSNAMQQSIGSAGQFKTAPKWTRLGYGRDRVFELAWSSSVRTALNGVSLDPKAGES